MMILDDGTDKMMIRYDLCQKPNGWTILRCQTAIL